MGHSKKWQWLAALAVPLNFAFLASSYGARGGSSLNKYNTSTPVVVRASLRLSYFTKDLQIIFISCFTINYLYALKLGGLLCCWLMGYSVNLL